MNNNFMMNQAPLPPMNIPQLPLPVSSSQSMQYGYGSGNAGYEIPKLPNTYDGRIVYGPEPGLGPAGPVNPRMMVNGLGGFKNNELGVNAGIGSGMGIGVQNSGHNIQNDMQNDMNQGSRDSGNVGERKEDVGIIESYFNQISDITSDTNYLRLKSICGIVLVIIFIITMLDILSDKTFLKSI